MDVILRQDVEKLGKTGDVVSVKDGYARNYLLTRGLALMATSTNLKVVEKERLKVQQQLEQERLKAEKLAERVKSVSCTITVRSGQDGKLFGSVTTQDIAQAYKQEGIDLDRRKIELPEQIKEEGVYKVQLKLHPEVVTEAKIWIVKE
ncbi:50S ribosomal protein L9 [Candidatus Omnitrophota bacterium]